MLNLAGLLAETACFALGRQLWEAKCCSHFPAPMKSQSHLFPLIDCSASLSRVCPLAVHFNKHIWDCLSKVRRLCFCLPSHLFKPPLKFSFSPTSQFLSLFSTDWLGTHFVSQANLEAPAAMFLPCPTQYWIIGKRHNTGKTEVVCF